MLRFNHKSVFDSLLLSIRGKLTLAFVVTGVAVLTAWILANTLFKETRKTVARMAEPNERLAIIDSLYYSINDLNRLQYTGGSLSYKEADKRINAITIRTNNRLVELKKMEAYNQGQVARIDTLINLVKQHKALYANYLKLKTEVLRNPGLKRNMKELGGMVELSKGMIDRNVVTTKRKRTTISEPVKTTHKERSQFNRFFDYVFGKRKEQSEVKTTVVEEERIKIDTLTSWQNDSIQQAILNYITNVSNKQQVKTNKFIEKERALMVSSNYLIRQMYDVVSIIKQQEAAEIAEETHQMVTVLKSGMFKLNTVLIVFMLFIGVLLVLVLFDVSKSNTYRLALQQAQKEAEDLAIAKQRFLANMSHELRTPLQAIIGFAEQGKDSQQHQPETLDVIYRSSAHLLQVVNDVLDYSKITSGKLTLNNISFSLTSLIDDVETVFLNSTSQKQITFKVTRNFDASLWLLGDVFRLKQVLFNVLGNALKFTNNGQVLLHVNVHQFEGVNHVTFKVIDTGIGMTDEQLKKIFDEFEQANQQVASTYGGSGLGLTIVQQLVQLMQGEIQVSSELRKGSEFSITIPMMGVKSMEPVNPSTSIQADVLPLVWVIDDDAFIRQLCKTILTKHHVKHHVFSSAGQLLAQFSNEINPVIFVDIRMPEMDGVTLCKKIKAIHSSTQVIALTAQAMPYEQEEILASGFDAVLVKPFLEADLVQMIVKFGQGVAFNLDQLNAFSFNDKELLEQNILAMITETESDLNILAAQLDAESVVGVQEVLHKLAGRVGLFGAKELHQLLRNKEMELANGTANSTHLKDVIALKYKIEHLLLQLKSRS